MRRGILALVVLLVAVGLVVGLTSSTGKSGRVAGAGSAPHGAGPGRSKTRAKAGRPRPKPPRAVRIASLSLRLEEPASPAIATGRSAAGAPVRVLATTVRYPAPAPGVSIPAAGAPFPLVIFSQGFDESAKAYDGLIDAWVRAGYVVAEPIYPFTDPSSPTGVNEKDIVNHPADLRYVARTLAKLSRNSRSPLHSVLNPRRVAVIGQSDGGDVSLAVAANSCCRDLRVRAAVILSGAELAAFGGKYYEGGSVPLLVTQGTADSINPPGCSKQLYDQAPQPKYYLNIAGAEHLPPYVSPGPIRSGIARVTRAFLNAYLKHGPAGAGALSSAARLPPQETLISGPAAPAPASTYCPGAP